MKREQQNHPMVQYDGETFDFKLYQSGQQSLHNKVKENIYTQHIFWTSINKQNSVKVV